MSKSSYNRHNSPPDSKPALPPVSGRPRRSAALRAARSALCGEQELTLIADTFQILASPTRLQIVQALSRGELCVGDLADVVEASPSAVSHHLRQLRQMRLVRHRREGKLTYYALDDDHVAGLFDLALDHVREELR